MRKPSHQQQWDENEDGDFEIDTTESYADEDEVDEASEESFPASDSPSWTPNTGADFDLDEPPEEKDDRS